MVNKQKLKKLAIIAAKENKIPRDIEEYVLKHLEKQELKEFLWFYKNALSRERVYVSSSHPIAADNLELLKKRYNNKELIFDTDETLGAGIRLVDNDLIVDFSFKNILDETIEELKN